ncbi:DUF4097 family beta strand repeat-containing protein [Neolewinella litorea]|uniref:hypothetical protein n=1 Tax=Neolewinella litorea TaxID=2562452 RepID=UPI001455FD2E|nr:hypothetical protein [Neolewinella litorea]
MLRYLISGLLLAAGYLHAQSNPTSIPVEDALTLIVDAHFSTVELSAGSGPAVEVDHRITVTGKPRPELGKLAVSRDGQRLRITETHPLEDDLKSAMTADTVIISGRKQVGYSDHNIDTRLLVSVPPGLTVHIKTLYGAVEVDDVSGLQAVESTYGAVTVTYRAADRADDLVLYSNYGDVDLALPADATADLELETEHENLLTDFDIAIDATASEHRNFFERIKGTINGGGARVQCKSPYNNVYLRITR